MRTRARVGVCVTYVPGRANELTAVAIAGGDPGGTGGDAESVLSDTLASRASALLRYKSAVLRDNGPLSASSPSPPPSPPPPPPPPLPPLLLPLTLLLEVRVVRTTVLQF